MSEKNNMTKDLLTAIREVYISSLPLEEQIKLRVQLLKEKASQIASKEVTTLTKLYMRWKE